MQTSEYKNIYDNESTHFYYVGYHSILLSLLEKYLPKKKGLKILDAGCGTGLFAKKLARFGDIFGVDVNSEAVKFARSRKINTVKASIAKLPFKDNMFDLITSLDVLCHSSIKDDIVALKEFKRVLKPEGLMLIKLPAFNWLTNKHDKHVHTKKRYITKDTDKELVTVGLTPIYSTYIGTFLIPAILGRKILDSFIPGQSSSSVRKLWQPLNNLLIILFKTEELLVKILPLPFGISLITLAKKRA